jgi:hypothetical protein
MHRYALDRVRDTVHYFSHNLSASALNFAS